MLDSLKLFIIGLIVVIGSVLSIETVTVSPLCPTNKVAPHKRVPRNENNNLRTFGAYYDLLAHHPPSSLQEEPQSDDPDDCGEIEDYDENDLSSITSQSLRRQGHESNRFLFSWLQQLYAGTKPTPSPEQTPPPYRPTSPPAGGYFGSNFYTPQKPQEPTNNVKPVNEVSDQENIVYRPGIVGGPSGHIIGLSQAMFKPTDDSSGNRNRNIKHSHVHASATHAHTHAQTDFHTQKPNRARKLNSNGILSSFFDLLY